MSSVGAVVVAAGHGDRLGRGLPKALTELAGVALVAHAVDRLAMAGCPPPVVVHTPGWTRRFVHALGDRHVDALVDGGASRSDSVRRGLELIAGDVDVVAVHDAARALTPPETIRAVVDAVVGDVLAAAPALPVADTLKRVDGDTVLATVDRDGIVAVQTPQAFPRTVLEQALAGDGDATDDLALVERLLEAGRLAGRIVVVPGSPLGLKITYPEDLEVAVRLARAGS